MHGRALTRSGPTSPGRALAFLVIVGLVPSLPTDADGQQRPSDPIYGTMPPPGEAVVLPELTADDVARRARVAARAGEVSVTIGEIEDHLAALTPAQREAFRTPAGRRGIVERILRLHLLAREAESRGALDALARHQLRRREQRVLRDLLEDVVRRDPGPIPLPSPPVEVPLRRFAVVLRTPSRETAEAWAAEAAGLGFTHALARANEVGVGQETPYGERGAPPDATPPIEPAVWNALFAIEEAGTTSRPIAVRGGFAVLKFAGQEGGYLDTGPDEAARRMIAANRAWAELTTQVRADRVRDFDPSVVDGVPFRMPQGRSIEAMQQLAEELTRLQAARSAAEAVQDEGP